MRPILFLATALIGLGAIAVPAAILLAPPAPQPAVPPAPLRDRDVARLQIVADEACRCTRERGTEAGLMDCWAGYEKQVAPYRISTMATACGPSSGEWDCLDATCTRTIEVDKTVEGLCSVEERRIVSAIWARELAGADSDAEKQHAFDRANDATSRAYKAFKLRRKVAMPPPAKDGDAGC